MAKQSTSTKATKASVRQTIKDIAEGRISHQDDVQMAAEQDAARAAEREAVGKAHAKAAAAKPAKAAKAKPATKRCYGVPMLNIEPHHVPADTEHFTVKRSMKDGLSRRCKACASAYRKARKADPTPAASKPRKASKAKASKPRKAAPKRQRTAGAAAATTATSTSA